MNDTLEALHQTMRSHYLPREEETEEFDRRSNYSERTSERPQRDHEERSLPPRFHPRGLSEVPEERIDLPETDSSFRARREAYRAKQHGHPPVPPIRPLINMIAERDESQGVELDTHSSYHEPLHSFRPADEEGSYSAREGYDGNVTGGRQSAQESKDVSRLHDDIEEATREIPQSARAERRVFNIDEIPIASKKKTFEELLEENLQKEEHAKIEEPAPRNEEEVSETSSN